MTLRPYQQEAHDKIIEWTRKSKSPCMIEAATGSGKSHIVSVIASTLNKISRGKHVLCLQPSKELLEQNYEKFLLTGNKASMFSASVGVKCLKHPVVFGTPMSVKNGLNKFSDQFCAVVIDECHGITPTVRHIVDELKQKNDNLRVIGMTATPYRLGEGYIYKADENKLLCGPDTAYFKQCIYSIKARQLIDEGYLTPPLIGSIDVDHYDTLHMKTNKLGRFDKADVDRAYHGQGRKTANIVAHIVENAKDRRGVLIFAATIQHAKEVIASLPAELSAIVTNETHKKDREEVLRKFKAQEIKYIVNVAVLTTGFDAPHVDVIALMRATESAGLLQQMIGRGLRKFDGKQDVLILDYAENIKRHCPDGDIFDPEIESVYKSSGVGIVEPLCPECGYINQFKPRKKEDSWWNEDENGYFIDLAGNRIPTSFGYMPSHHGRRCFGFNRHGERCEYRWTFKTCDKCKTENDIAARYCSNKECKAELVDPNEKLSFWSAGRIKDPSIEQTEPVIDYSVHDYIAKSGNECLKMDITTPTRSFTIWIRKRWDSFSPYNFTKEYQLYLSRTRNDKDINTITYKKDKNGYYRLLKINE